MNDNNSPAFQAGPDAILGVHYLCLVWSAQLCLVGAGLSPWERLHDRLLWFGYIQWLHQDVRDGT